MAAVTGLFREFEPGHHGCMIGHGNPDAGSRVIPHILVGGQFIEDPDLDRELAIWNNQFFAGHDVVEDLAPAVVDPGEMGRLRFVQKCMPKWTTDRDCIDQIEQPDGIKLIIALDVCVRWAKKYL